MANEITAQVIVNKLRGKPITEVAETLALVLRKLDDNELAAVAGALTMEIARRDLAGVPSRR